MLDHATTSGIAPVGLRVDFKWVDFFFLLAGAGFQGMHKALEGFLKMEPVGQWPILFSLSASAAMASTVSSCTLSSSSYSTRSRGPLRTPPLSPVKNKNKGKMKDLNNVRKENPTEWVEATNGHGTQPDVELPEGYKPPKFKIFDGMGDPRVYLRTYCDKLVGVGKDERIRMKLFIRSLKGDVLSWYIGQDPKKWSSWVDMASDFMDRFRFNTENALDMFYIQNLKKKPTETFHEYATRWSFEAAKVKLALEEEQMNKFFVQAQDPQYYE
ncbi:uncharacterized protein [Nicotiana sylvestris]|uniref:uncharacterized protein n=1 Tax=Nicotiana sylvestris TaxID=4096 RepID=UPI00388CBAD6